MVLGACRTDADIVNIYIYIFIYIDNKLTEALPLVHGTVYGGAEHIKVTVQEEVPAQVDRVLFGGTLVLVHFRKRRVL
jgi:hypothetical protein